MIETIKKYMKKALSILKEEWISTLVILVVLVDGSQYYVAMQDYKVKSEVVTYKKYASIVASSDTNNSVTEVKIVELLQKIDTQSKVYMIKEEKDKLSIVAVNNTETLLVKSIPFLSMTFTLESKLLDQEIAYEWLEKQKKPTQYMMKLFDPDVINVLLLLGIIYFLMYTSGIKLFSKEFNAIQPKEIEGDFSELIGYEDIKAEARQLEHIITQKERYAKYGIHGTFNILFSGKAGTGKTKFALYLAKDLQIPIVSSSGSLDEMYVGTGARKIRNLFKEANKLAQNSAHKSCILFIDEGQNLLRSRGHNSNNKWEDDTSNELLAHLDGVEKGKKHNIIVIIASNFHENNLEMDPAMLRRFKKKIHFRDPNIDERKEILLHYLKKIEEKEDNIDISYLAKNMSGMTPAIIESVVQEAGLMSLRENIYVGTELLLKAFERMVIGNSSRRTMEGEDSVRRIVTVHELGHFLVEYHRALLASDGDILKAKELTCILKISSESIAQIGALGFALREQNDSMMLKSVDEIEWDIKQLYGGMAAEEMVYGKNGHTTGGTDDVKKATKLLEHLIVENSVYSTSKLNYKILGSDDEQLPLMEEKSKVLYEESMAIVKEHEGLLLYLSGVLMREWSLSKDTLFHHIRTFKK